MKNYRYYIGFFIVLFFVLSCKSKKEENKTVLADDNQIQYSDKTIIKEIKALNPKWFSSWEDMGGELNVDDFKMYLDKKKEIVWEEFDINNSYFKQYDSLLISLNNLAIDLYSYNTRIERENDNILVEFDVDTKVCVIDKKLKKRSEIVFVGPSEIIEDAVWLNKDIIVLFAYIEEYNESCIPLILFIDIKFEREFIYEYIKPFKGSRENYFLVKYPNVKFRH